MYEQYIKLMQFYMHQAYKAFQQGNTRLAHQYEGEAIKYLELALEC